MPSLKTIVNITITKGTQTVAVQAFNVATVFGPSARFGDPIRYYSNVNAMITDGFLISDPEYIFASEYFEQSPSPSSIGISHFTASIAQVDTFAVNTLTVGHPYTLTLDGTVLSYTALGGDTQQIVLGQLLTQALAISPAVVSGSVSGSGAGALLTLTSTVPGIGVSYTAIDALLTHVALTPNHSIVTDIQTCQAADNTWYGILCTSHLSSDIAQIAAYTETQLKVFGTSSSDSGILTTSTTDIASVLSGKKYTRTFLLYHATPADGIEAAWFGRMLPTTPGAANWNFKTLAGITPDGLSDTQSTNAQGKSANIYVTIGGINLATLGVVSSGEYIDVTIFIDWLTSTMQANVYSILVNNDKIPFTNKGIIAIENGVAQTLQQGQDNGGLSTGWVVSGPDISQVPTADKATRTLNGVTFNATLAGAINKVNIHGFVSV